MRSIDGLKSRGNQAASQKNEKENVVKVTTVKKSKSMKSSKEPTPQAKEFVPEVVDNTLKTKDSTELARESFLSEPQSFDFDLTENDIKEEKAIIKELEKKSRKTNRKEKKLAKKKDKKKVSLTRKIITSVLLVIVLTLIGLLTWVILYGNDWAMKFFNKNIFEVMHSFTEETHVELKADENGRTNVLIFGTSGMDMEGTGFGGYTHDGAALTDSIMVASYDQKTQDIAMVSLPRDLKADTTCTATGKINEVYWCNNIWGEDEAAGARALMNEMKTIFGVDIQYYIHVNWGSLMQIVDAVGGIDIVLDEDVVDYMTDVEFYAGEPYHIDGFQALALARSRHTGNGDFTRANSQQKILIALKNKVVTQGMDFGTALGILNAVKDNVYHNISPDEIKTVIFNSADMDIAAARQVSLYPDYMTTGTLENGISYVFPREGVGEYYNIQQYIKEQFKTPVDEGELTEEDTEAEPEYLYKDY